MADAAAPAINTYKLDLRAIQFTLWEHLKVQQLFDHPHYAHSSREECDAVVDQCAKFATQVSGPLNGAADRTSCRFENGNVIAPAGFKQAWKALFELGLMSFGMPTDSGGFGGPHAVEAILQEIQSGANMAFNMYPGLTHGAADMLNHCGTAEQKALFLGDMLSGRFSGTMCLSEPHAGSDVGSAKTRAKHIEGDIYEITGQKCWISAGDHDLTENIIHMVLARIDGAPAGTKGLSLFIVPKVWVKADGSLGEANDVSTGSIEHKMGIKASATAVLNFGENGNCRGILMGGVPHQGIKQMFRMMNSARIAVGIQGIGVAATAYLNALAYARTRLQGPSAKNFKDPNAPRVSIIEHADVRRMLLEMKAKVEGMRTLAVKLALHHDLAIALKGKDAGLAARHQGQMDLLTPIVKAYCSDQAFRIAELAIQTYGGAGYVQDNPVEQYCRDAKILSIYEGTNHIQSADLIARKLQANGGEDFRIYLEEIETFVASHEKTPGVSSEMRALGTAVDALKKSAAALMEFFMSGKVDQVMLNANDFLGVMADVTIAHLLLDAAVIAEGKRGSEGDDQSQEEFDFYAGKVAAAKFFVNHVLPGVHARAATIAAGDRSALDIPDRGFSSAV